MEVYQQYSQGMYNVARRIVNDDCVAEDVVQEAFMTSFSKLDQLEDDSAFPGWLKTIVIRESLSYLRKNEPLHKMPLDEVSHKLEATDQESDFEVETSLEVKHLMNVMKKLKKNYQLVLTLFFIEGYDYEEISEIMQISQGNCRTMLSRAKESLRKKIEIIKV